MYLINRSDNQIERLEECKFSELGIKERDHLQEWIAKDPCTFDEELLIIQKEFAGFSDTHERLDLLALDKDGNLVIIENKLDDSGRDVTWQALKYASYCSSLSKDNIRNIYQDYLDKSAGGKRAEEMLFEFFDNVDYEDLNLNTGFSQRIILVAVKFRKEVTSTVLWLMNFKLRVQCFIVTPYALGEQLFLNFEQIIPTKDAEDYMIVMAEKVQDEIDSKFHEKTRHTVRREFWMELLKVMNTKGTLFQNISPTIYNWIGAGSGVRGASLNFAVTKTYGRAELYIDRGVKEENKMIFDYLFNNKEDIENRFGGTLVWERLDEKRACRIKSEINGNVFDKETWPGIIEFMTDNMLKMESAFKEHLAKINKTLKSNTL